MLHVICHVWACYLGDSANVEGKRPCHRQEACKATTESSSLITTFSLNTLKSLPKTIFSKLLYFPIIYSGCLVITCTSKMKSWGWVGAGEMAYRLRVLTALAEDLSSVTSTHPAAHGCLWLQFQGTHWYPLLTSSGTFKHTVCTG